MLNRIEPFAIFIAYIGVAITAYFAWFYPPKVAGNTATTAIIIEAILLTVGALFGLWGHLAKYALIEFWGLVCCIGGMTIFLFIVVSEFSSFRQFNYGQFIGVILLSMGLMFSHAFKLYHEITESWINLPPTMIQKIYTNE